MTPVSASFETARAFIEANTEIDSPPACPEIRLWTATDVTPLWEATEEVLLRANLPPPYWAFCWAGGQALTRWVLDHPHLVEGKRVLDFAAGSGVTAIGAALCGAAKVEAAEIDHMASHAIRLNAELNGVTVEVLADDVVGQDCRWDLVFAGDVCYEAPMTAHIWPWLKRLAADGAMVVMADPGRAYLPKTGLLKVAGYTVATCADLESRTSRDVTVFQIVG